LKSRSCPSLSLTSALLPVNIFASRSENPFPQIEDGALTSHQLSPRSLTYLGRIKHSIWMLGWRLRSPSVRFAIKTGAGAALLASAAFTKLRPLWLEWRGEWALISYMVIMSPSLGATNFLAFCRILGTVSRFAPLRVSHTNLYVHTQVTGAATAVLCYTLFPENAVVLPLLGALVSIPCFYVIVTRVRCRGLFLNRWPEADHTHQQPQYGPSSRFVLLTFNLTALYAFNLREVGPELNVLGIGIHRTIAVVFGVIYGLVINVYLWPYEARRELRRGLSDFFLNAAHLYLRLVSQYSNPSEALLNTGGRHDSRNATESTALLSQHLDHAEEECVRMEVHLQQSLIKVRPCIPYLYFAELTLSLLHSSKVCSQPRVTSPDSRVLSPSPPIRPSSSRARPSSTFSPPSVTSLPASHGTQVSRPSLSP